MIASSIEEQLHEAQKKLAIAEGEIDRQKRYDAIRKAAADAGDFNDPDDVASLAVARGYNAANPKEILDVIRLRSAYMVKGYKENAVHQPTVSNYQFPGGDDLVMVKKIFGKDSDAKLAAKLAKADKAEYTRLRAEAKRAGLL